MLRCGQNVHVWTLSAQIQAGQGFFSLKINPSAELLSQRHAWVYFHFPKVSFDDWGRIAVNCRNVFDRATLVLCLLCDTSGWECSSRDFLAGGRSLAIQGIPLEPVWLQNLQGMERLPLPEKMGLFGGFGLFCAVFVLLEFFISVLLTAPMSEMGDSEGKYYQRGYFPLVCLWGFVLFPCSRHTQVSVPVSALKISRETGLFLQSQGHKKSITY